MQSELIVSQNSFSSIWQLQMQLETETAERMDVYSSLSVDHRYSGTQSVIQVEGTDPPDSNSGGHGQHVCHRRRDRLSQAHSGESGTEGSPWALGEARKSTIAELLLQVLVLWGSAGPGRRADKNTSSQGTEPSLLMIGFVCLSLKS